MASDKDVRAWARETDWRAGDGEPVSARGGVGRDAHDAYNAAHNGHDDGAAYPDGMTAADFELQDAARDDDDDDLAESRPKAPPSQSTRSRLRGRLKTGGTTGRGTGKKQPPRTPTSDLIGSAWRMAAKVAQPIPPMYRTLRLQSVIAGPLIDEAVKGTAVDRVLQPIARLAATGETTAALLAPNLAIAAMAFHSAQAAKAETEPNPVVMQGCVEMMRYGLMAMIRVGGDAFTAQVARERDDEERYGATVDMLIAYIMAPPGDPAAEESEAARMAYAMAGEPVPGAAM